MMDYKLFASYKEEFGDEPYQYESQSLTSILDAIADLITTAHSQVGFIQVRYRGTAFITLHQFDDQSQTISYFTSQLVDFVKQVTRKEVINLVNNKLHSLDTGLF